MGTGEGGASMDVDEAVRDVGSLAIHICFVSFLHVCNIFDISAENDPIRSGRRGRWCPARTSS